jgi:DNA modification methylase
MSEYKYLIGKAQNLKTVFLAEEQSPRLILTSPPYFDLLNYGDNKKQIGFGEKNYSDYLSTIAQIFQDCYDVSTPDATFWLIVDTFKKDQQVKLFPFDIVNALKEKFKNTWLLRDIIIWNKEKNLPWSNNGNFKNQHEYILFFTKGANFKFKLDSVREIADLKKWWKTYPERYSPNGKAPSNIWTFTTPIRGWGNSNQNHLCPFPFPLVEKILTLSTDEGDLVFDPFSGSGSVLGMAKVMKRNSIGIDVNKKYRSRFKKEVINGAKTYWTKREKELAELKELMKSFKETNGKLRKLKVASNICHYLNSINKYEFVYFTRNKSKNNIEIVIMQNGRLPKTELNDDTLNVLIKQAKVNPIVTVLKEKEFIQELKDKKAYKYKFDKFYSYTSPCNMKNILGKSGKYEYMYSDIAIKIRNN